MLRKYVLFFVVFLILILWSKYSDGEITATAEQYSP
jgi:hypothetical protein